MKLRILLALNLLVAGVHVEGKAPVFKVLGKGTTPAQSKSGPRRQDLSAAVCVEGRAFLAYDGGVNSEQPEIRVAPLAGIEKESVLLKRVVGQRDLEGMTFRGGQFYVISSLSQADEDTEAFRLLTEFSLDPTGRFVRNERSVVIRDLMLDTLRTLPDERWFSRVAATFGVKGGLNAEGLSWVPDQPETLLVGLRSPLWGEAFGDPTFGKAFALNRGQAILAFITRPFSDRPTVRLETLDLGGHGVRDIQYLPDLKGYLILGGPVDKAAGYSLWFYAGAGQPERIRLEAFEGLCRPEAIMPVPGRPEVYLFSEEGGYNCDAPPYTYLHLEYHPAGEARP
ncbi:MAG: hypothetical protein IPN59_01850 [Holophaga sp.]|nr:hypothetical protein [Holophaga sp.]